MSCIIIVLKHLVLKKVQVVEYRFCAELFLFSDDLYFLAILYLNEIFENIFPHEKRFTKIPDADGSLDGSYPHLSDIG